MLKACTASIITNQKTKGLPGGEAFA